MADQLCAPEDLASLLEMDLDAYKATMLVECGTAVVQEAASGQRIVQVVDDAGETIGTSASWLDLPQIPVTEVGEVTIDGEAIAEGTATTQWRRPGSGSRLWRSDGWAKCAAEPSTVGFVYTHGYPAGHQQLQLGRNAVLGLIRGVYGNPTGAQRVAIDDFSAAFERLTAQLEASPNLRAALRRQYGPRGRLVRVGG